MANSQDDKKRQPQSRGVHHEQTVRMVPGLDLVRVI